MQGEHSGWPAPAGRLSAHSDLMAGKHRLRSPAAEGPTPAMLTAAGGRLLHTWLITCSVYVTGGMFCR